MITIDGIDYEVFDGFNLVSIIGKELQEIVIEDEDGNSYSAVVVKEDKKVYITGELNKN